MIIFEYFSFREVTLYLRFFIDDAFGTLKEEIRSFKFINLRHFFLVHFRHIRYKVNVNYFEKIANQFYE